uniref:Uncharacterized protein n=1 Tax=Triticum urartu TaxID=4572 RepID=A0A8R7U2N8_TRIUA
MLLEVVREGVQGCDGDILSILDDAERATYQDFCCTSHGRGLVAACRLCLVQREGVADPGDGDFGHSLRCAVRARGGVGTRVRRMASCRSSNNGARHCSPTAPEASALRHRMGEGVWRTGQLDGRGGVGEASNPGGLDGDGTGSS